MRGSRVVFCACSYEYDHLMVHDFFCPLSKNIHNTILWKRILPSWGPCRVNIVHCDLLRHKTSLPCVNFGSYMHVLTLATKRVEYIQMIHCKSESWSQLTCFFCFSLNAINLDASLGSYKSGLNIPNLGGVQE